MTTATQRRGPPATMTLWRLERARLLRSHRWMILFGVYALFGALGALSARYMSELVERFGEGMTIVAPDPRPADGIVQFVGNASQLGVLAVVVVAAAALSLVLPIVGVVDPVQPWLPSTLLTAVATMAEGTPASAFTRALAVTVAATAGLLALAARRFARREV